MNQDWAEGAIFLEPRLESAVLDAVLEDKPAQPLPCGSYLVKKFWTDLCLHSSAAHV